MKRLAMARQQGGLSGISQQQLLQLAAQGRLPNRPPAAGNLPGNMSQLDFARLQQLKNLPPGSLPNGLSPAIQQQLLQMSQNSQASQGNDSASQLPGQNAQNQNQPNQMNQNQQNQQNQNQNQPSSMPPQQSTPNLAPAPQLQQQQQPAPGNAPSAPANPNAGGHPPPWQANPIRNPANMLPEEDWLRVFRTVNHNPNLNYPMVGGKQLSLYKLFTLVFAYNGYRFVSCRKPFPC
jgi:hypothetical protein